MVFYVIFVHAVNNPSALLMLHSTCVVMSPNNVHVCKSQSTAVNSSYGFNLKEFKRTNILSKESSVLHEYKIKGISVFLHE